MLPPPLRRISHHPSPAVRSSPLTFLFAILPAHLTTDYKFQLFLQLTSSSSIRSLPAPPWKCQETFEESTILSPSWTQPSGCHMTLKYFLRSLRGPTMLPLAGAFSSHFDSKSLPSLKIRSRYLQPFFSSFPSTFSSRRLHTHTLTHLRLRVIELHTSELSIFLRVSS